MTDHDHVDNEDEDTYALVGALRAYAIRYRRRYGLAWAARHIDVHPAALQKWMHGKGRPDVALAVLHLLDTDDVDEIRRMTSELPRRRRSRRGGGR